MLGTLVTALFRIRKIGVRLIQLGLATTLLLFFAKPMYMVLGILIIVSGLTVWLLGAIVGPLFGAAIPRKSVEQLDQEGVALARRWIAEFEAKYG